MQGNYIGTTKSGKDALGNATAGVIDNSFADSENLIGGTSRAAANTIAFNETSVQVGDGFVPVGISILGNSIFSNDGLGIDLAANGVTANDALDLDPGPNNLQNYPEVTSAKHVTVTKKKKGKKKKRKIIVATNVAGSLNSTPGQTFTLQFFSSPQADPSGFGEGKTFLGQTAVTTDASGNTTFGVRLAPVGGAITATATDDSTGDTSEFSNAVTPGF